METLPWPVLERILYFMDTETKLIISKFCKNFGDCLFSPRSWSSLEWHDNLFPQVLIEVVRVAGKNIEHFACCSQSEKDEFSMDLNKVMCNMINLKTLRLQKCTLVYHWGFLRQTNLITHMYIDECLADPNSMIVGINSLANLRHLAMTRCKLMIAYNICQAVKFCRNLEFLDVTESGKMKSVLACVILNRCTSLKTFLFSNLYTYDNMYDRLRWFRIARMKYKKVKFADDLYERVDFYSRTDLAVRQLLNIAKMQEKYAQREQ